MSQGKVKTVTDKGYGFITVEGSDKDVFYHENSLEGVLAERKLMVGDVVTFDVEETPKGVNATNIALLEE
jgi:CspA family cold shock protein